MSKLAINDLTKRYQESTGESVIAVEDLSIDLDDGELLILVGPSGCGKSTTLHTIAGLEEVSEGEIRIGDENVNEQTPEERDIALVFQNYALYPHMTGHENMSFGLRMATDLTEDEIESRVQEAAELLDIEELLDDRPSALSGGQQQRVALGRAIVREPSIFLLDEPLSNLDAKLRSQMRTEIQRLQSELDVTTVYVTHDQTEAMTMGDRIAVLNDGKLQQIGTPMECYFEPNNRFVADFIGEPSMNFFKYDVQAETLQSNSLDYPLTDKLAEAVGNRNTVWMGIRPENIELATESGPHTIKARVDVVEPMGDQNVIHATVGESSIVAAVSAEIQVPEDRVALFDLSPSGVHLFDWGSEETLVNSDWSPSEEIKFIQE